jgi:hypothetical protein
VEERNYVEVYEDCTQQYAVKPLLSRQRFSSDINQLIHVGPTVFLLESVPVDDIALTHQARKFEECEIHLEEGLKTLSRFFHKWRLRPNSSKTEVCVFHFGIHLGITLDRTLSYKPHLEKF